MAEIIKTVNLYYFHSILEIGGIETFFYYLAKKYKNWDLTIVYSIGNEKQLNRLKQYVRCIKYTPGQEFECERAFFNFNTDIIDHVKSSNGYYLVLHGDYKDMLERKQLTKENLPGHPKITNYVGVSQQVCDSWKEITGKKATLCYNPFVPDEPNKQFTLISATRLSVEKGGNRIAELANQLDKRGVNYTWYIFSNRKIQQNLSPNIKMLPSKLNIIDDIAKADFLVQLSDNEGYCYSIVEALNLGVPVIATPIPVFKEIGLNENNSITLNFDLSNINEVIDTMLNKNFDFTYQPKNDSWDKLLIPGFSSYQKEIKSRYIVEATSAYKTQGIKDAGLGRIPERGERWEIDGQRYQLLSGENNNHTRYVNLVEVIPYEGDDTNEHT